MSKKRKYPISFFIIGIIVNMFRTFYVGILSLAFWLLSYSNDFFLNIAIASFGAWILYLIINQIQTRKLILSDKSDGSFGFIMDNLFGEKGVYGDSEDKIDMKTFTELLISNGEKQEVEEEEKEFQDKHE